MTPTQKIGFRITIGDQTFKVTGTPAQPRFRTIKGNFTAVTPEIKEKAVAVIDGRILRPVYTI